MFTLSRHVRRVVLASLAIPLILGAPADAATKLAAPSKLAVSVTTSSAALSWAKVTNAKAYRVCLQKSKATKTCFKTVRTTATKASFTTLAPTGGTDYFFRVTAERDKSTKASGLKGFNLATPPKQPVPPAPPAPPAAPAAITHTPTFSSVVITWAPASGATAYTVCLLTSGTATACKFTSPQSTSTTATFTGLTPTGGTDYYYVVISHNAVGSTSSPKSSFDLPLATVVGPGTTARVVSFNVCGEDKCVTSSNKMQKWSTRKPLAGALVRSVNPDIVATQESTTKGTNFGTELPGFTLAHYKSAKSLFFKTSKYTEVRSGEITLNSSRKKYAVWAELKDNATGTRFIVVDVHLTPGKGKTNDDYRTTECMVLISSINRLNAEAIPVVYAGDFNSNKSNANQALRPGGYDAPLRVFTSVGLPDTYLTSKSFVDATWNSANQARTTPLMSGDHVDHVFVTPDVTALSWQVLLRRNGNVYATPFASDHNALVVDLVVPGR